MPVDAPEETWDDLQIFFATQLEVYVEMPFLISQKYNLMEKLQ